jgi:hypothetical protein
MSNDDIADLVGIYPTPLRWNAETGVLWLSIFNSETGEWEVKEIELNGPESRFAMDLPTRERGYGLIRAGVYDMKLTPVGTTAPDWPGEDYKPAIGAWLWNPLVGEVRLETNQVTTVSSITAVWDQCRRFKECSAGEIPIIAFVGSFERHYRTIGKVFLAPRVEIIGLVLRDKVPTFAKREVTVQPPPALDTQIPFGILPDHSKSLQPAQKKAPMKAAAKKPKPRSNLSDPLDDAIPEDL